MVIIKTGWFLLIPWDNMLCEGAESSDWANGGDVVCFGIAPKFVGIDISRFCGGGG